MVATVEETAGLGKKLRPPVPDLRPAIPRGACAGFSSGGRNNTGKIHINYQTG
jgi:hypothetical protein